MDSTDTPRSRGRFVFNIARQMASVINRPFRSSRNTSQSSTEVKDSSGDTTKIDQPFDNSQNTTEIPRPSGGPPPRVIYEKVDRLDSISYLCLDEDGNSTVATEPDICMSTNDYTQLVCDPGQAANVLRARANTLARQQEGVATEFGVDEEKHLGANSNALVPVGHSWDDPDACLEEEYYEVDMYTCSRKDAINFEPGPDPEGALASLMRKSTVLIPPFAFTQYMRDKRFRVEDFQNGAHDPKTWGYKKKLAHTILYGLTTLVSQYNSAVMGPIMGDIQTHFNTGFKAAVLTTSLYIIGIAFGPILFAPMSEVFGRKYSTLFPFLFAGILSLAAAYSSSFPIILLFRFMAGIFSAAPIVIGGGMLSDIWEAAVRGDYLAIYSNFVTLGPCLSPIISSAIMQYDDQTDWRTVMAFSAVLYFIMFSINMFALSESYKLVLLQKEAQNMRARTGNRLYHTLADLQPLTASTFVNKHVRRPMKMMFTPIIAAVAGYAAFVFGVFYLVATSVTQTFSQYRHYTGIQAGAPMLAMYCGAAFVGIPINIAFGKRYQRLFELNFNRALPEERLYPLLFFAGLMPLGVWLFGFTIALDCHWIIPCAGLAMMGGGFFIIFQGCLNYLVDAFPKYAASAIAVNTCLRSLMAGFFPLFSKELFHASGIEMGCLFIGLAAMLFMPIPFVLYAIGRKTRQKVSFD